MHIFKKHKFNKVFINNDNLIIHWENKVIKNYNDNKKINQSLYLFEKETQTFLKFKNIQEKSNKYFFYFISQISLKQIKDTIDEKNLENLNFKLALLKFYDGFNFDNFIKDKNYKDEVLSFYNNISDEMFLSNFPGIRFFNLNKIKLEKNKLIGSNKNFNYYLDYGFTEKKRFLNLEIKKIDKNLINAYQKIKNVKEKVLFIETRHKNSSLYFIFEKQKENKNYIFISKFEYSNKNIIAFGSKKHYELIKKAKTIVYSDYFKNVIPLTFDDLEKRYLKTKKVFIGDTFYRFTNNYSDLDLFYKIKADQIIIDNNYEKEVFLKNGYNKNQMLILDLPKWNIKNSKTKELSIVFQNFKDFPKNDYLTSEVLRNIIYLLNDQSINKFINSKNIKVNILLFKNKDTKIIDFLKNSIKNKNINYLDGDERIENQEIISNSNLIISDHNRFLLQRKNKNKKDILFLADFKRELFYKERTNLFEDLNLQIAKKRKDIIETLESLYNKNENKNSKIKINYKLINQFINEDHFSANNIYLVLRNIKKISNKIKINLKKLFRFIKRNFKKLKSKILILLTIFFKLFKINNKKIIFESFLGTSYSGNPKYISKYITENYPEYKKIWIFNNPKDIIIEDKSIKKVKRFGIFYLYHMLTSKYWISNSRIPLRFKKRNKTKYLQTWHGTPLKKLGLDIENIYMPGTTTKIYHENFLLESQRWDLFIAPNNFSKENLGRAFGLNNKKIVTCGYPRNDILVKKAKKDKINSVKNKIGIKNDSRKIILYTPTFRDDNNEGAGKYKNNLAIDFENFYNNFKDEYILLVRSHYLVSEGINFDKYDKDIINVASYDDIQELYLISDILITDYSSTMFDFGITKKPQIYFMYDYDRYKNNLRGFYFDPEKILPGPIVKNNEELTKAINAINFSKEHKNYDKFYEMFCQAEKGNAAKTIVEKLFKL